MTTTPIPSILTSRIQSFLVDGTDYSGQSSSASIQSAPTGLRFLGRAAPENEYTINITAGQDLTVNSLWMLMYTRTDEQVPVILKPYGNDDAPSAEKPWVSVTAWIAEPSGGDLIGGDADTSTTTKRTFSVSWQCDRPILITSIADVPVG